jgi:Domain of unknown function (DUF4440)
MTMDELLELEEGFWKAAGDPEFYEEHFAPDGKVILSMGVLDKPGVVSAMSQAEPWHSFEVHDPTLIQLDDQAWALVYEATGRRDGDGDDYRANILSVYRANGGGCQLVLHQQTPIEAG